jgi:glycosyltransferase involved in cell wall biosynthesis
MRRRSSTGVLDALAFAGIWVALAAAALTAAASVALGCPVRAAVLALAFGGTVCVYGLDLACNEELLIGRTLRALNDAGFALGQPFEVVVVDDASTDRTAAIARKHGARVVPVQNRQISATRNAGAKEASGDMFIFVDADTVVTRTAVRAAVDAMRAGAAGGGCAIRFDGHVPLYGRVLLGTLLPLYRLFRLASGSFLFCTRPAFEAVGGFDEQLFAAEEIALSRALHQQGRFIVLREFVTTSGRKVRTYAARELLGLLARLALSGEKGLRQRKGLEPWYGERRPDPGSGV